MDLLNIDTEGYYDTLFLDRDGVINKLRPNDYVKKWEEFEFLPGVFKALTKWAKQFKYIIVVTNQRGVGKGMMSEEDLSLVHANMINEIEKHGGRIDKIYYCTSLIDDDLNRKPNIGMAIQAKQDFPDIDFSRSLMIGDSESDMQFANKCKMKGIKI
jgi:histidinol-phosphate phosphatase family protein